ncbi:efflux transporter outer membrane subunit [Marinobacter sp.]|uniref:efflux transporter outer membrane subunit n=1 Tax=Marinobacter sp. TaxID=50741 RepID=UPI001A0CD532|nr:efflux transporter outer membrane subunit [Marinobacter sp.]MBE0485666.1 efflux transporter outer membrane subunit [Marinobacter sp.]
MTIRLTALVPALLLAGCATFTPEPVGLPVTPPDHWEQTKHAGTAVEADWWRAFNETELDRLIEKALKANPNLAAMAESVIQADLQLRNAGAALLPSLSATASSGRQASRATGDNTVTGGSTSAGLTMDYELDLWGRLSASEGSALATFEATRFDYAAARITLVAAVASTWFEWLELQQRIDIANINLELGERTLALVEVRFRNGVASRAELSRQQTSVLSLRNAVPPLEYQARQRLAALRVLIGDMPFAAEQPAADIASVTIPLISPQTPANMVTRRPDLAAQEARLVAASADIEQTRAALLPSVSLSAAARLSADGFLSLSDPVRSVNGLLSLSQALFDGGQRRNTVAISESRRVALLESYRGSLLTALQEVGDALDRDALYRLQEQRLQEILVKAEETLRLTEVRYREGADELLTLLDSQRSVFEVRQQLSQARLNRLIAAVDLYKALGGGWNRDEEAQVTVRVQE